MANMFDYFLWRGDLDSERRKQFLGALFEIVSASGAKTIPEFEKDRFNAVGRKNLDTLIKL